MSVDFGTVTIPAHYRQIPKMDFDALLPHLRTRIFHDEWNVPETWPGEITALVNDVMYATPTLIDRLPNLKVISFAGTGVWDRVDVAYATRRGIAVCNVPGWGNDTIAEFTFALLLALARKLFAADAVARRPEWKVEECYGVQLRGKTIGLIGLGNVGQRVAEIAEGFGLRVLCYTRRPDAARRTGARVEFVPLDELLRRSDVLSLHALLTDETRGMIYALVDAERLGFKIEPAEARDLVAVGERIKAAAAEQLPVVHPENPAIHTINQTLFAAPLRDQDGGKTSRNAVVVSPGRLDRSPCGTGTSARLAVLHARGLIQQGEIFDHVSVIGSHFYGRIVETTHVSGVPAVVNTISGRAWLTGISQYGVDPDDPYPCGYTLPDTWFA